METDIDYRLLLAAKNELKRCADEAGVPLSEAGDRGWIGAMDVGKARHAAEVAADAIFEFANIMASHLNDLEGHIVIDLDGYPVPSEKVVAGPSGHWYAWYDDELVAFPMSAGDPVAPQHPARSVDPYLDGWYAPDDLQGFERANVLGNLGRAEAPDRELEEAPDGA